jgi:N-acetylglutamate synthase-like GNAT family acetyltransferase
MKVDLCFLFDNRNRSLRSRWLPQLRQWVVTNSSFFEKLAVELSERTFGSLKDALAWRAEEPSSRLVVAIGFPHNTVEAELKGASAYGEPVIVNAPNPGLSNCKGSASFLSRDTLISAYDVRPLLRKSLIRISLKTRIQIRPPASKRELSDYFSLRYRVWQSSGYLRDKNKGTHVPWELDFWDRMAFPFVAIELSQGKVVGCVRLLSSFGKEEQPFVTAIEDLLRDLDDQPVRILFRYHQRLEQPFDLLEAFPSFGDRFRLLLKQGARMAEIGRVAVEQDYRRQYIAETLVDTALDQAKLKQVNSVFLACPREVEALYRNCGFSKIEGLEASFFFNIQRESIAMENRIRDFGANQIVRPPLRQTNERVKM